MTVSLEVVEDPARSCAALMVGAASRGGDIVLSGGSTPKAAYAQFVAAVRSVGLDLSRTTFWVGDERCVAPDDERSNLRMLRESLLDALPEPAPIMHPIQGELGPQAGAEDYERQLDAARDPRFDLMLVGVGADGHTLSLFPGQAAVSELDRLVVGVPEAGHEPFVARVTMTMAAVALAQRVVVLASGEDKADAIRDAFGADAEPDPAVPASLLAAHASDLTLLLDPAAAGRLDGRVTA